MKRILILIALFCAASTAAQPFTPTSEREPVRSGVVAYPTQEESLTGGTAASKYLTPLDDWTHNDTVWTTDFTVPFAWANRQVLFHIDSASADYEVLVNGMTAGRNANPNAPADFNITKQTQEGRNRIEIRLARHSDLAPLESWKHTPAPAMGSTYILSQPTMRIRDVAVRTWFAGDEMKAEVAIIVRSSALNPKTSRIYYELTPPADDAAAQGHKDIKLDMRREDTLRFVATIPQPLQWSPENPVRYSLRLKTQYEGRYVEYLNLNLGFRTVEMTKGQMRINGVPVTLHAAEVTPDITPGEIVRLREQGYNTLKLRAGIVSDSLYEVCDALGVYLIVQAPLDSRDSGMDIRRGGNPTNDPAWQEAYIERTADSYYTAQRHPSVIAFSLAEQSANGINLYESYLNMKRMNDPRPVIYRDAKGEWNNDSLQLDLTPRNRIM